MGFFSKKGGEGVSRSEKITGNAVVHQTQSTVSTGSTSGEQYRPVFLLCYPSATFKSHWALFVPLAEDKNCRAGRKIHVTGNVQEGFNHEIIRNYDLSETHTRPQTPKEIGIVSTRYLVEVAKDLVYAKDTTARDPFEEFILSLLRHTSTPAALSLIANDLKERRSGPPRRVTLSDCQWWIMRIVEKLVEQNYMLPPTRGPNKGMSPLEILKNAPKH
ncbi:uncharacterized protein F4812DRAFT_11387 [Daldinia caldariorum]|uniref:uncharacterized protein n=1 Tax=Daldinia caldariorum TaxID=326644 RepID=UPI0020074085|nr:uncharacterized protein F4812DRAFT_11387 [Daldinia caldariorum]KAI1472385.1 hypothetical protein F4812DRAFT_11387 [Daldinia caldariorum]